MARRKPKVTESERAALALLGPDARKYILERCNPVDFLIGTVTGEHRIDVYLRGKKVGSRPPSFSEQFNAATILTHKIVPDLKTVEAKVEQVNMPDGLEDLSDTELLQLERLTKKARTRS